MRPIARLLTPPSKSLLVSGTYDSSGAGFWSMPWQSSTSSNEEPIGSDFDSYVERAYKDNGIVFACSMARMLPFTEARFQYQEIRNGRPGLLFGNRSLDLLENPWPNGTTGELLARMEQDATLAGNFYATVIEDERGRRIRRLRPDWVKIVSAVRGDPDATADALETEVIGYMYCPPKADAVLLSVDRVVHYSPIPDPASNWRGMSWLTPILREIQADTATTKHKAKFFDNGATPSFVIKYDSTISPENLQAFSTLFAQSYQGADKAYKVLHLGGGADVSTTGADMRQLDFKATQGAGEPLALDTPIPTPNGWSTMGELAPGDQVYGRDGLPCNVVDALPVHVNRDCYRVTFNDRTSIVADAGHIWTVMDRNTKHRSEVEMTTVQIAGLIQEWTDRGHGANRIALPPAAPLKCPDVDLLVDPYVLGAWLGDGYSAGAAITGADNDLAEIAAEFEVRGYTVTRWACQNDGVSVIGVPGGLMAALRALGVLGNKHIPSEYLRASSEQRLDLLRGLMDTDGSVGRIGKESCEFSSKWEALARQVAELARSLGSRVTISEKLDHRSRTGSTWRVTFRADPDMVPFALSRKAARCVTPLHVRNRAIVSVESVPSVPVRCIVVDSSDHLFLAGEGFTVTHNSRIAAAAGVGAIIARLSEGMQGSSLNQGNYHAAKRQFADMTLRPLWRIASASLAKFATVPEDARLWTDVRDVAFLAEDAKDESEILAQNAQTVRALVDAGYQPDAVINAVEAGDLSRLVGKHSGLYSVQLQEPGAGDASKAAPMPPSITVNVPESKAAAPSITINVPEIKAGDVTVNVPESKPADVTVNVPEMKAPNVNVTVEPTEQRATRKTIEHTADGRIAAIIEEPV